MKLFRFFTLLLALCLCLTALPALAATEADARAMMEACGIGGAVSDADNLMGMCLEEVRYDSDGDVYVHWSFANEMMRSNLAYAFIQMRYFDPDDLSAPYSPFTINPDNTLGLTFKEGDMINVLDFAHLDHEAFSPESGVIFMYFNGSGEGAPEQLYTVPLAYVLYIDDDGPHALDAAPHYAPQALIDAFDG